MFTCAAGVRDGGGAETSGAPSPSEGNGAVGFGSGTGAGGVGAGAAGRGASAGARASEVPLRLPNTTTHSARFSAGRLHKLQFGEQRCQHAAACALGLGAAGEHLSDLTEHVRGL